MDIKKTSKTIIFIFVLCIWVILVSFGVDYVIGETDDSLFDSNIEVSDINNSYLKCGNLSLGLTVNCLRDYMKPFYNYTIMNITDRTIEDIKLNGGDCYDYNYLYYHRAAKELGFNSTTVSLREHENI